MAGAGAAVVLEDSELDGEVVRSTATELLADEARLGEMSAASASLAKADAADRVAAEVLAAAGT
jgi:UDP-N-acetylglucosamine:LPS N-acetylglucosamine transferase